MWMGTERGGGNQRPDGLEELKKVKVIDDEEEETDKKRGRVVGRKKLQTEKECSA